MKEAELRKRGTCSRCAEKLVECEIPAFAVIRQQNYMINLDAVQRQSDRGIAMGGGVSIVDGGAIVMHIGPDDDMARPAAADVDLTLCGLCRSAFEEWLQNV